MNLSTAQRLFAIPLLVALLAATAFTSTVFADDDTPPPADGQAEAAPLSNLPTQDDQAVESSPPAELVDQLPADTAVVVVDNSGDTVPLASEEAAQALVSGDPLWCPAGVAPKASAGGCSPAFDKFGHDLDAPSISLMGWLNTNDPNRAGTIWVEYDYDFGFTESNPFVVLDGANYANMDNFALMVQGGWQGTPLSTALHTADPYSYFDYALLSITGWTGAVTVNNVIFDDSSLPTTEALTDAALNIATKGNIKLTNVIARNNSNANAGFKRTGIILSTTSGTAGTVTLTNVTATSNEDGGLWIYSRGAVTATNTIVDNNGTWGFYIDNTFATTAAAVSLKGFKQYNNNGYVGLDITSNGAVTMSNVNASNNGWAGSYQGVVIDNRSISSARGVTIGGTNLFADNTSSGLTIFSDGAITLNNITSIGNVYGVFLDNCDNNGTGCDGKGAVKLGGVNTINKNGNDGLYIASFGAITINNLTANGNQNYGAHLYNDACNFDCSLDSSAGLTILGYASLSDNSFGNQSGLEATSYGNLVLNNVTANDNGNYGAYLWGKSITIKGTNIFNGNASAGLHAFSIGLITTNNLTANGNNGDGAYLDNGLTAFNITMKGNNFFTENSNAGLDIFSHGSVLANNVTASDNGLVAFAGAGVAVNNTYVTTPKPVTFTGYLIANGNFSDGIDIDTDGAVILNNVTANNNYTGLSVDNSQVSTRQMAVTLKGSNLFNDNYQSGMEIYSYGLVTLSNVTANHGGHYSLIDPASYGAYIVNGGGAVARNVVLSGVNNFNTNYSAGLWIETDGSVTLSRVSADHNDWDEGSNPDGFQGDGIVVYAAGNITLTCAHTLGNYDYGYFLTTTGTIYLKGIFSDYNGGNFASSPSVFTACALP